MAPELTQTFDLSFEAAQADDAPELAALHTAAARHLSERFGHGHWSYETSERAARSSIRNAHVLLARHEGVIVGTLQLQTKKPWAIDRTFFTEVARPLYLTSMAVLPAFQRRGIGRRLLDEAAELARAWPAQSLRLDAYDGAAGAGPFYAKCGFSETGRVVYKGAPLIYFERLL